MFICKFQQSAGQIYRRESHVRSPLPVLTVYDVLLALQQATMFLGTGDVCIHINSPHIQLCVYLRLYRWT